MKYLNGSTTTKVAVRLSAPFKAFYRATLLQKLYCLLLLYFAYLLMTNYGRGEENTEGFAVDRGGPVDQSKFVSRRQVPQIYDQFYVNVYDELLFSKVKNDFEIGEIIANTKPAQESRILDLGSGTGHHVGAFVGRGFAATQGIDLAPAMVKQAQKSYPTSDFNEGDALDTMLFPGNSFTHILCLYFTIYYIPDKVLFFSNCMHWLQPGGYLALHLVTPDLFDPILPAGDPFKIVSPQKYAEKRITSTVVKFDSMDYKANFELKPGKGNGVKQANAVLTETFAPKKGPRASAEPIKQNEHEFYMPSESEVLLIAKAAGFIVEGKSDMTQCQYAHQYIYYLLKPS